VSNSGQPADAKGNLEEILQVALSHSLLSQADVNQVLQSVGGTRENVVPQAFARQAIQLGKLTLFQAKLLLSKDPSALSIGPYLILDKIGQGGMGSVYKARHKSMDRIVALKVLRRRDGFSQETIKRFQREVLAAAKLLHPNIVTAFDAGEQNGLHFLVMEYVSGGDLKSLLDQRGPLSVAQALNYTQQVARGMQYAHDKQIIHRDIKPANLLLDSDGCVKILDLGLARIIREETQDELQTKGLTADGALMGTVDYLSPEQSLDTKTADVRSDIYSLGCTLYTLLTGEAVYPAGTLVQKILAHREAAIPSLRFRRSEIPEALDQLFQQMIAKSPAARPQSMAAVIESLQQIAAGGGVSDVVPRANMPLSPTSEDAFLETLIVGSGDTVKKTDLPAASPANVLNKPLPSAVRPALAHRRKIKRSKLALWQVGALLGASAGVIGLIMWMLLFSQEAVETDLAMNEPQPQPKATTPSETPKTNNEQARVLNSPTPPSPNDPNANKLDGGMVQNDAPVNDSEASTVSPDPEAPKSLTGTLPDSRSSDNQSSPLPPAEPVGPRVLIVGVGTDEIPELSAALQQAKPNDTILIRHRGPLELSSTDLTGKSPLTIVGDEQAGVDYWPIIRQRTFTGDTVTNLLKQDEGSAQPLFFGDRVEIHFKKLHLACGGYGRERLASFLRCNSGVVSFEKCTLTASTDEAERFAEGLPLPLIDLTGAGTDHLDLRFTESLVRGARLKSLVRISSEANVSIEAEQFLWAGGQGSVIELGAKTSSGTLRLKNSTFYNFTSLVNIPVYRLLDNDREVLFNLELENSILAARERGESALLSISGGEKPALDNSRWTTLFHLKSSNSTLANIDEWLPSTDRIKTLNEFARIYELDGKKALTDTPPNFRVFPAGVELQEVTALDLEIMDSAALKKPNDAKVWPGARATKLPIALPRVCERAPVDSVLARKPRGLPKVLEVSQKNGPIKSLEEAFNQIQGEDVEIVIADSETYVPARNFDIEQKSGVLYTEAATHLTVRGDSAEKPPTLVISDSQLGVIPGLAHWEGTNPQLFLFSVRSQSLKIDGIQFKTDISRNMRHSVFLTTAPNVRMTNCRIMDQSTPAPAYFFMSNGYGVTITSRPEIAQEWSQDGASIRWIENVVIEHPLPPSEAIPEHFVQLPTAFSFQTNKGTSGHTVFRNCAVGFNHVLFFNTMMAPWVEIEGCTLWGRLASLHHPVKSIRVRENVIFAATNPVLTFPPGMVDTISVNGGNNALWMGNAPLTPQMRNQGPLRWMPGELLTKPPEVKTYKLQGNQKASKMAEDGGPVGFRLEKLPK
jgi:serine/threonine protein kinase